MKHNHFNNDFWKEEHTLSEWESILDSENKISLLISYFESDSRFSRNFSELAIRKYGVLYSRIAKIFMKPDYRRNLAWLHERDEYALLLASLRDVFEFNRKKNELFMKWFVELKPLEFDVVLYYFSAVLRANVNSEKLWKGSPEARFLFEQFIAECSGYYVKSAVNEYNVTFKWKEDEAPDWDFDEHGASSFRFKKGIDSDPLLALFRDGIEKVFKTYLEIESKLIVLVFGADQHSINTVDDLSEKNKSVQLNGPKMALSWNTIVYALFDDGNFEQQDLQWIMNSVRNDSEFIQRAIQGTLLLQSLPQVIHVNNKLSIDIIKWTSALTEFTKFQIPSFMPRSDFFGHFVEDRRAKFGTMNAMHKSKSLTRVKRSKLIELFCDYYKFPIKEVELVLTALTHKIKEDGKYDFRLSPFISVNEEELLFSLPSLARIQWSQQLVLSLAQDDRFGFRNKVSEFREELAYENLGGRVLRVYRNVKMFKDNRQLGEIDVLVIASNRVYFIEVKGMDKINGYFDFHQKFHEKVEAVGVDQLMNAVRFSRDQAVTFSDHRRTNIRFPEEFEAYALLFTNHFTGNGLVHGNVRISNLVELTILCNPKMHDSFLKILEWYYPDKAVIPYYQELFAGVDQYPDSILSIIYEGAFWKQIKTDLA